MIRSPHHPQNDFKDDLDRAIDRTLHALGHAEPSPGLQDRILALGQSHTPNSATVLSTIPLSPSLRRVLSIIPLSPSLRRVLSTISLSSLLHRVLSTGTRRFYVLWSGETLVFRRWRNDGLAKPALFASATVFLALLFAHSFPRNTPLSPTASSLPKASPPGAPASPAASSPMKVGSLPPTPITSHAPSSPPIQLETLPPIHLEATRFAPPPTLLNPDQQALADLQTPSFPAPALPPTPQERLVRLMLRRGERHDLAQLYPAQTAAFAQQDRIAFGAFFDPPVPRLAPTEGIPAPQTQTQANPPATQSQGDPQ